MNKKFFAVMLVLFSVASIVTAQVSVDPDNEFYSYVEKWENLGIIEQQPPLRPYAVTRIKNILETVMESNNDNEVKNAQKIYNAYYSKFYNLSAEVFLNGRFSTIDDPKHNLAKTEKQFTGVFSANTDYEITDYLSIGAKLGFTAEDNLGNKGVHYSLRPYTMQDDPHLGGSIHPFLETDSVVAFEIKDFTIQAGVNHSSYGPFFGDNIVFSSTSKHNGVLSANFTKNKLSVMETLFCLSGSSYNSGFRHPGKYMFMHSVDYNWNKYLSFSLFDISIMGDKFNPLYLMPCPFIITEGLSSYNYDNILEGFTFTVRPVSGLAWKTVFSVDDAGIDKWKEYKDITLRAALQTGVHYNPKNATWFDNLKADYTFVTPYTFTHAPIMNGTKQENELTTPNYQNYTSAGRTFGTVLPQNSDRITLSADFIPVKNLKISTDFTFIRHGNVNESLKTEEAALYLATAQGLYTTDGGIFNHSYIPWADYNTSNWFKINLLTQDTLEYTVQTGLKTEYTFPKTKVGTFAISLNYIFEYIHNYGVDNDMYPGYVGDSPDWFDAEGEYGKTEYFDRIKDKEAAAQAVYNAHQLWLSQLKNVMNHYLTINFKYTF